MSGEKEPVPEQDERTGEKEDAAREKRELLQSLMEGKEYNKLVEVSIQLIKNQEKNLIPDALEALRFVTSQDPKRLEKEHLEILVTFLDNEDDMIRASTVLALKPMLQEKAGIMYEILSRVLESRACTKNCLEESIRLLGHMATHDPTMVIELVPSFLSFVTDDDTHVRNRSIEALKILSKHAPKKIENGLKAILNKNEIHDPDLLTGIDEIITDIIKRREIKDIEKKVPKEEVKPELIPEVQQEPEPDIEPTQANQESIPTSPATDEEPVSEEEIKKEIGAKIEEEFSKIEEPPKPGDIELKTLKEIKTERDLLQEKPSSIETEPASPSPPAPAASQANAEGSTVLIPSAPDQKKDANYDDIKKRQLDLKEKELQRREEELKQLEIEKKELELVAKEHELQVDEMRKAKIEQMENEIKRKEQELKEKELALKMKELEEKEKKLAQAEESMKEKNLGE